MVESSRTCIQSPWAEHSPQKVLSAQVCRAGEHRRKCMRNKYKFLHPPSSLQLFKHKTQSLLPCVKKASTLHWKMPRGWRNPLTLCCKFPSPDTSPLVSTPNQTHCLHTQVLPFLAPPVIQAPRKKRFLAVVMLVKYITNTIWNGKTKYWIPTQQAYS